MIVRDPAAAGGRSYDLAVVGGGVYGIALTLEAARRGLAPVLVERRDFGGETSWSSLRIVHGGLRYLQSLDLARFFESVAERSWMLRHFPDQVEPLCCLMPLYGEGLHRPAVFRLALAANHLLSWRRNLGLRPDRTLAAGGVLPPARTRELFPAVDPSGLRGGALWWDAVAPTAPRLLMEMLRWAAAAGATLLNYVEARELVVEGGRVAGLGVTDLAGGGELELRAPVVVNCAGPWCREVAARLDRDRPELFAPSIAFNLLLDRAPPSELGLAVRPRRPGARSYFLLPWRGRTLAGTYHAPWPGPRDGGPAGTRVGDELAGRLLEDLNHAVPGFDLGPRDVLRVLGGVLPATAPGRAEQAKRPVILDHGRAGGPRGLYSLSGVKLTTARRVAEETLRRVLRSQGSALPPPAGPPRPAPAPWPGPSELRRRLDADRGATLAEVRRLAEGEACLCREDLLLRRTDWGLDPRAGAALEAELAEMLPFEFESAGPRTGCR